MAYRFGALYGDRSLWRIASLLLGFFALLVFSAACSKEGSGAAKAQDSRKQTAVPVVVAPALEKSVPLQLKAIGNVQAYSTVSVKAQVEGELLTVHFKEGEEVRKGDLLFTIDSRPFEAQLKQAEANLAKDKAQLQNARKQVTRYSAVVSKGFVSEEAYDKVLVDAATFEASVKADEAAIASAKLKLEYCAIRSPIDGVAGGLRINQGNVIKANDNDAPLVIINQVKPVYVSFALPERSLTQVKRFMAERKLEVAASVPGDAAPPVSGELSFIENAVDMSTGTIQMKAAFSNEEKMLWPGQFVNVVMTLTTESGVTVAPAQAIQTGQEGQYVFVLKPDSTVEYRPVEVERTMGNDAVVAKGLHPGDKVVVDGQLRFASGSLVKVVESEGRP